MSKVIEYLKEVNLDNEKHIKDYITNSTTEELVMLILIIKILIY